MPAPFGSLPSGETVHLRDGSQTESPDHPSLGLLSICGIYVASGATFSIHDVTCIDCLRMEIQAQRAFARTMAGCRDLAVSAQRAAERERDQANGRLYDAARQCGWSPQPGEPDVFLVTTIKSHETRISQLYDAAKDAEQALSSAPLQDAVQIAARNYLRSVL